MNSHSVIVYRQKKVLKVWSKVFFFLKTVKVSRAVRFKNSTLAKTSQRLAWEETLTLLTPVTTLQRATDRDNKLKTTVHVLLLPHIETHTPRKTVHPFFLVHAPHLSRPFTDWQAGPPRLRGGSGKSNRSLKLSFADLWGQEEAKCLM